MNTYILDPDRVGRRTLEELCAAAERGLDVGLVYDAFGSGHLSSVHVERLRAAGARVLAYNPIARWPWSASRLVRNHRKILVVDDELAFCGGMNISEDYAGQDHGRGRFRDTHLFLEGPCARDLGALCESLFSEPEEPPEPMRPIVGDGELAREGSLVQILESNISRHWRAIQRALRWTIRRSQRNCFLSTPYFVPPLLLTRNLIRAARRGVDVRVLTAGHSDVPIVNMASQHLYGRLVREGVRIFEMDGTILHSKTVTIDGVYASVGSFNLDRWSYRRNLEVAVGVLDARTARELEEHFERDLESSREVQLASWTRRSELQRIAHWLAYQLMRI